MNFNIVGYHLDYYCAGKYIGSLPAEKDREVFGYEGRKHNHLTADFKLRNKTYKKGVLITTELIPICGSVINEN